MDPAVLVRKCEQFVAKEAVHACIADENLSNLPDLEGQSGSIYFVHAAIRCEGASAMGVDARTPLCDERGIALI